MSPPRAAAIPVLAELGISWEAEEATAITRCTPATTTRVHPRPTGKTTAPLPRLRAEMTAATLAAEAWGTRAEEPDP